MTTKAKEAKTEAGYNALVSQTIPLVLEKNGRKFHLTHTLQPLTDARFFEMEREMVRTMTKLKALSTEMYAPKHNLWKDLVESRSGYKESQNWKETTHRSDCVAVINALLHTQILSEDDAEVTTDEVLYDDEGVTVISFNAMQSGSLIQNMTHSFRLETKAEMDEFLAIEAGQPNAAELASALQMPKAERLYRLGLKLLKDSTGYAEGSPVPAWHLAGTTETYFARQIAAMGKSFGG